MKAVIFDLNGVFIQSPYLSDRFGIKFGVDKQDFLSVLKNMLDHTRHPQAGDAYDYWQDSLKKWGVSLDREQFFDFWFSGEVENTSMVNFAKLIKNKGIKIFVLSNNFQERADYYKKHFSFIDEIFDGVYYSWQTGFVKPDTRAYQKLLSDNHLSAEDCVYFDNSSENIEAAKGLGIRSFLYKDINSVKQVFN